MPLLPRKANSEGNKETLDDRSPVPADDYLCHIVKTEFKQTKAKNGHYLSVHFKILEGDYKGRMLFTNLNLDNPNPVAVEIANKELNSICEACGLSDVEDSDELLEIPMMVTVKINEGNAQYPASNETTGYAEAEGQTTSAPTAQAPEPVPAASPQEAAVEQVQASAEQAADAEAPAKLPWE